MKLTKEQLQALARLTMATKPEELTCDEWVHLVGRYAELVTEGQPVPTELQPVAEHLQVCPECSDEFEALRRVLEEGDGSRNR